MESVVTTLPVIAPRSASPTKPRVLLRTMTLPTFELSPKCDTASVGASSGFQKRVALSKARRASCSALCAKVAARAPTFEIEEQLLAAPTNVALRIELGYRYAEQDGSKLWAVVLLEQVSLMHDERGGWRFYQVLGHAHYHLMLRHPRPHHCCVFHLHQATETYKLALSYLENMGDVLLVINYATALFMQGVKERPLEMLATVNLRHGIQFGPLDNQIYVDRLFTHFQILSANECFNDALTALSKIQQLQARPTGYATRDLDLVRARCLQLQGDLLASSELFSRILLESFGPATTYADEMYATLWHNLCSLCLRRGHLFLAIDYATLALTYAKAAKLRATLYYARGVSHYCLHNANAAEDDYRRGRNASHEIKPLYTLRELKSSYKDAFALVLSTSIPDIVASGRRGLGKTTATLKVQRQFRRFLHQKSQGANPPSLTQRPLARQSSFQTSIVAEDSPPVLPHLDDVAVAPQPSPTLQPSDTIASLKLLHAETVRLKPYLPHAAPRQFKAAIKRAGPAPRCFLSPDFDRPDARRLRSLTSYRRLGYSNGDVSYVQHWRALLDVGLELFTSPKSLARSVTHVRAFHPTLGEAVAICALVDSDGNVDEACGKLSDAAYTTELQSLVVVLDVGSCVGRRWRHGTNDTADDANDDDEHPLFGVPEIDAATGKLLVHDLRTLLPSPTRMPAASPPRNVFDRVTSPVLKRESFRAVHIIDDHVTAARHQRRSKQDIVVFK
ncbi:hypothetical protein SPRG_05093 [Saprolegnia parasitica CBS 223.65]|uniref:Uncharacterized protein n=1 Tax=Saprolegnia parasitica (strain CBS 223.65) TaxID=695850 RepID=A0A067CUB4_SAPPC|nr:hypothetical protein SPRG_05093 [Saprolegnia parasitica CBS 223.65]KDO30382.1 hypothetical protein SPRG_05093 [Saprolegnia parasitica CBS 223.65]|eukprot:XP_012198992.1 hypothetical protein SPRG_05093 [Saprolegnia parasitica CBS 223.65]